LLSQAKLSYRPRDFDRQARLDLELVGIRQTQVGKDVAGTRFDFDAVNDALCDFVAPLPAPRQLLAWPE
jgi:hypothetical protein